MAIYVLIGLLSCDIYDKFLIDVYTEVIIVAGYWAFFQAKSFVRMYVIANHFHAIRLCVCYIIFIGCLN